MTTMNMRKTMSTVATGVVTLGVSASAFAATGHHSQHATGKEQARTGVASRLDDGKDLLPKAKITEQQATETAQSAASGGLNEVDLEYAGGKLVFNVDVGSKDVKVDASNGHVVSVDQDD
jgi:uncharacterized membrane protein YkoI